MACRGPGGRRALQFSIKDKGMHVSKFEKLVISVFAAIAVSGSAAFAQLQDQVNVYFDANASVFELPDVTYPSMITGYIVLDHPSDPEGIRGWELALTSDPNLTLVPGQVFGDNINVSNFPEFMVGYADTIAPSNEKIVLATFSIYAVGPGAIYVTRNGHSGFPSIQTPVYLPCANIDAPVALGVREGLYGGASATIGTTPMILSSFFEPVGASEGCPNFDTEPNTLLYGFPANSEPWGVEAAASDYLFVTDPGANRVLRYGIYGTGPSVIDLPDRFTEPRWLAVDNARNWLYVRTQGRPAVLVYDFSGAFIDSIGGYPFGEAVGQFRANSRGPIALDSDGNLYVVDNNRIQSFTTANGWSAALVVTSGTNPAAPNFWIEARSLAVDSLNRLYLLDGGFDLQVPALVHVYQGPTCIGAWGRNGNAIDGFRYPWAVRVSEANKVYVSCRVTAPGTGVGADGVSVHGMDGSPIDVWSFDAARSTLGIALVAGQPNFLVAGFFDYAAQEASVRVYGREMAALSVMSDHFQTTNYDFISDPELLGDCYDVASTMRGVAADSATALLLVQDWPAASSGQLSLRDSALPSELQGLGALQSIDNTRHGTTVDFSTQSIGERDVLMMYYLSPIDFVRRNVAADIHKVSRTISLDVAATGALASTSETFSRDLEIERVPVAFVHGFLGEKRQFQRFTGIRDDSKWVKNINWFDIDYASTSGDSLVVNGRVVDSNVHRILQIASDRGIAASQVDFIAHSMGGLILRYIASTSDAGVGNVPYRYRSSENRGMGYCHKVLFCNTPHKGTPLARDISDMADYVRFAPLTMEGQFARAAMLAFMQSTLVLDATPASVKKVFGAAIRQLRDDSPEIASLDAFDVPSFGIVGTGGSDQVPGIYEVGMWGVGRAWSKFTEQPGIVELYSQEHDGAVPRSSQQADMLANSYFHATNWDGFHESIFREPPVLSMFVSGFTRNVVAAWNTRSAHSDSMQQSIEANSASKALVYTSRMGADKAVPWFPSAADGSIYVEVLSASGYPTSLIPGQTVTVRVQDGDGLGLAQAHVSIDGEFLDLPAPGFQATYTVPLDAFHSSTFRGMALTTGGEIAFAAPKVVSVNMSGRTLMGISADDDVIDLLGAGDARPISVNGQFSDNVSRHVPGSLVSYSGWDPSVVSVTDWGDVIGLDAGVTEVTASYGAFHKLVTVRVLAGDRVYNKPIADAGTRYSYCGNREVCLDGSASYDYDQALGEVLQFAWDLDGDGEFDNASGSTACWTFSDSDISRVVGLRVTDSTGRVSHDYALLEPVNSTCADAHLVCTYDNGACGARGIAFAPGGELIFIDHSGAPTQILLKRLSSQCALDVGFNVSNASLGSDVAITPAGVACFVSGRNIVRYDGAGQQMANIAMPADRVSYESQLEVDGQGRFFVASHGHGGAVYIDRLSAAGVRQASWRVIDDSYSRHVVSPAGEIYVAVAGEEIVKVHEDGGGLVVDADWANDGHLMPVYSNMVFEGNMAVSASGELHMATLNSGQWRISRYDASGQFKDAKYGHSGRSFIDDVLAIDVNDEGRVAVIEGSSSGVCAVSVLRFDGSASGVVEGDPGREASQDAGARVWLRVPAVVSSGHQATVHFGGARHVDTNLSVYDLRGMLIRTLFDGSIEGTEQQVSWNQEDRNGIRVAAGMYFMRLAVGAEVHTKKVIIVR